MAVADCLDHPGGMGLDALTAVVEAVRAVGCRFWLEGGWGVDALVGRQTRPHRDVDLDVDAAHEADVLAALAGLGYAVETDQRPTRVELAAPGRGWVDVHPLVLDEAADGTLTARQAALAGGWHTFPAGFSSAGRIAEVEVPCVSLAAQLAFHEGYPLRPADHHDLALLRALSAGPREH